MPELCDINVLLALVAGHHPFHAAAVRWVDGLAADEAVLCRVAQMGLLRLLNNPSVMNEDVLNTTDCWLLWRRLLEDERFRLTLDEPAGLDADFERYTAGREFSPRLWSDAYLAAFAHAGKLTLITFDRGFRRFTGLACNILVP